MEESRVLVLRAAAGESGALDRLIELHEPRLLAYVRTRVGPALRSRESVRDLVQDVMMELVEGLRAFEYRSEPQFRAWLFQLAARRITDRARYHARGKRDAARDRGLEETTVYEELLKKGYSSVSSPLRRLQRMEDVERLEAALSRLEERDREVLSLSYFCGLTLEQLAEELGVSIEAARKRKTRAQARLAALMDPEADDQ